MFSLYLLTFFLFSDTFVLEKKFQEPLMVTCTLPAPSETTKHEINCINMNSNVKLSKCTLGFDSESRLFKSQRVQAALAFCHKNLESWYRGVRLIPNLEVTSVQTRTAPEVHPSEQENEPMEDDFRIENENQTKQLITKEVIQKFPKSKKWYRHFKILTGDTNSGETDQELIDGSERVKSIERYKDMSKLIEEKFGKKSYNPVKKSASFMYSNKRMDLEDSPSNPKGNPSLLKCQSLDTQIYSNDDAERIRARKMSDISNLTSEEFQMCILHNETGFVDKNPIKRSARNPTKINFDEIKPVPEVSHLKKSKPDLIPTLKKEDLHDNSYITERLCSEFHVKTKIQKRNQSKQNILSSSENLGNCIVQPTSIGSRNKYDEQVTRRVTTRSVVVQVHEESLSKTKLQVLKKVAPPLMDDVPYSKVADEVLEKGRVQDENIYAEICENVCTCNRIKKCDCKRTRTPEYCYVKLGSNGDSVTMSDSDEAIYNTLR